MVRRLVEDEEIGALERHERERNASPLAPTDRADLALHFVAAEPKRAEAILHLASAPQWPLILDRIEQRLAEREVGEVLPKPRRRDRSADLHLAARRFVIAKDGGDDRCPAGAVRPDDAPPFTFGDGEGDVLEEFGRAEGDADVGEREKSHRAAGRSSR